MWLPIHQRDRDERLTLRQRESRQSRRLRRNSQLHIAKLTSCIGQRRLRPTIRPPAAQRHIHAQPKLPRLSLRIAHVIQHGRTQKSQVHQSLRGIIDNLRINKSQLHAANAVSLHLLQLSQYLGLLDRDAKPPPANHRLGGVWRMGEALPYFRQRSLCLQRQDSGAPQTASPRK